jgi:hypothetical protein
MYRYRTIITEKNYCLFFLQEERKPRGKEKEDVDLLFRMEGLMSAAGRINLQSESNMEN